MGKWTDKISGRSKKMAGKATDDKSLEAKGKWEETKGSIRDAAD